MSDSSATPPVNNPPTARRPWQFDFWTLVEVVLGAAIVSAVYAEMGWPGLVVSGLMMLAIAWGLLEVHGWQPAPQSAHIARILAIGTVFVALPSACLSLIPRVNDARGALERSVCSSNLSQLGLALENYHHDNGCFPPPYLAGPDGRPWHSWRVLILPWLDQQQPLYNRYDFSEAWNGPKNSRLAGMPPPWMACPGHHHAGPGVTDYYYVVGGDRWPAGTERVDLARLEAGDGPGNSIMLIESHSVGANWLEPRDLTVSEVLKGINQDFQNPSACSWHGGDQRRRKGTGGVNAVMFNSRARHLPATDDVDALRALVTIDGREAPDATQLPSTPPELTGVACWWPLIQISFIASILYRHRPRCRVEKKQAESTD